MKIFAKTAIRHNGNDYQPGQELEDVNEQQAAQLVESGAAEVKEGVVKPVKKQDAPDKSLGTNEDKDAEAKEIAKVANLPIRSNMGKDKLIGIARANGLEVEKTATPAEVRKMIKEHREKNNITIEDEQEEESKENATGGADKKESKDAEAKK